MNDVFFYNFSLEALGQFVGFISLNVTQKYCGWGNSEIHFPISRTEIIEILQKNPYIICVAKDTQMIVTGWRLGEDIAIFGRTPEWLMTKRVLAPFSLSGKSPEQIAEYAVKTAMGDFVDVADFVAEMDMTDYSEEEPKTVYDTVCGVLQPLGLGFNLRADVVGRRFIFSVRKGKVQPLLISVSNRTACDMRLTRDMQELVDNCGWYQREMLNMGNWSASENSPALKDSQQSNAFKYYRITSDATVFGLTCTAGCYLYCDSTDGKWKTSAERPRFVWQYIDNSKTEGAARWEGIVTGVKTFDEAKTEFGQMKIIEQSETALRNVEYGTDYTEGDIVRLHTQFGNYRSAERKRVCAVEIFYDIDTAGVKPVLQSLEE